MKMKRNWILPILVLSLAITTPTLVMAAKGGQGKPGGGEDPPPEPELPPIEYVETHRISYPLPNVAGAVVNDFNDLGMIVGNYFMVDSEDRRAYLYDPADPNHPNSAIDLNDLDIVMIDTGSGNVSDFRDSPYYLRSAVGLNNNGLIVGAMALKTDAEAGQGFVLDIVPSPAELYALPDTGQGWIYKYANKVNDNGDILGAFRRPDLTYGAYLYNPGLRSEAPYALEEFTEDIAVSHYADFDNPLPGIPPTIVVQLWEGSWDGPIVKYTRGGSVLPVYELGYGGPKIADNGKIAFRGTVVEEIPINKKRTETVTKSVLFRAVNGVPEDVTDLPPETTVFCEAINNNGTILLHIPRISPDELRSPKALYHDDWGLVDLGSISVTTNDLLGSCALNSSSETEVLGFTEIAVEGRNIISGEYEIVILTPFEIP